MAHTKKEKAEDRKYVQLAPETVMLLAESAGIDHLSPNVATSLSEDATYRTRELAHVSSQFMRHCKRTRLTPADVSLALKWYDEQPILGVVSSGVRGGGNSGDFAYCDEAEVFTPAERPLGLLDLSVDHSDKQARADPDPIVQGELSHNDTFSINFCQF